VYSFLVIESDAVHLYVQEISQYCVAYMKNYFVKYSLNYFIFLFIGELLWELNARGLFLIEPWCMAFSFYYYKMQSNIDLVCLAQTGSSTK